MLFNRYFLRPGLFVWIENELIISAFFGYWIIYLLNSCEFWIVFLWCQVFELFRLVNRLFVIRFLEFTQMYCYDELFQALLPHFMLICPF